MAEATTSEVERGDLSALLSLAAVIRARDVLGRSEVTHRLFDFLVDSSVKKVSPREIDIAIEVFGRTRDFDVSQDASVRVYVHRLRRKLDEFYAGPGQGEGLRLTIPKGEYRVAVEPQQLTPDKLSVVIAPPNAVTRRSLIVAAALIALLIANALTWQLLWPKPVADPLSAVRGSAMWSTILSDQRPVTVVVGDYYIFGETDDGMNVKRLVREFSINSREELYEFLMNYPQLMEKYQDVGLRYLPISISFALNDVLPILQRPAGDHVQIMLASELTPEALKTNNIVFVGLLSGLGALRDRVFAGSRYSIGDTYDEIIDNQSQQKYFSQMSEFGSSNVPGRDYGILSTFSGPTGNRFVVIAGTRDVAVRQVAEEITDAQSLVTLNQRAGGSKAYEALYEVGAMQQLNIDARLINVSTLATERIWNTTNEQHFPSE